VRVRLARLCANAVVAIMDGIAIAISERANKCMTVTLLCAV
jgi:hypothetical protein